LTCLKFIATWLSGSVSLFSESLHSLLDLVSAAVTYFTLQEAMKPADKEHPFGHGKMENLSSLLESLLLLMAAFFICSESLHALKHPSVITHQPLAIGVLVLSLTLSYGVYRHNLALSHAVDSRALESNAYHFFADFASNTAVLLGFLLIHITQWKGIDAIVAFLVAGYLTCVGIAQMKKNIKELIDNQLPEEEVKKITDQINSKEKSFIRFYHLRTRKSGSNRHIDFHLMFCGAMPVYSAHQVCDQIEEKIKHTFIDSSINIHIEPCEEFKTNCHEKCPFYQNLQKKELTNGLITPPIT
jgi:cation diffusion facilitator family transporter